MSVPNLLLMPQVNRPRATRFCIGAARLPPALKDVLYSILGPNLVGLTVAV